MGDAVKYDEFKKKNDEDGEFDEISKYAVNKVKQQVEEVGVRRSRRSTKRVKYVDDFDPEEFNDSSSDEEAGEKIQKPEPVKKRNVTVKKKTNTAAPKKKPAAKTTTFGLLFAFIFLATPI